MHWSKWWCSIVEVEYNWARGDDALKKYMPLINNNSLLTNIKKPIKSIITTKEYVMLMSKKLTLFEKNCWCLCDQGRGRDMQ